MSLFMPATNTQAFLKAGFLGFTGSGKTFTATVTASGLVKLGREAKYPWAERPVLFFDTETGSDWMKAKLEAEKIQLHVAKTRAFSDLLTAVKASETEGAVLLIDSITHVWRELVESYMVAKKRKRLEFQDWGDLKATWGKFTDAFINSQANIIICGRAGYEYDHFEDDRGKKQIEKVGIKMKAEGEMGHEPSLLVYMERQSNPNDITQVVHVAHVLKDRSDTIDGKSFVEPTFECFRPHIEKLNLGGVQLGVDTSRNSRSEFPAEDREDSWIHMRQQRDIALDEIKEELVRAWPSRSDKDQKAKADCLEEIFGTRSWTAVENMKIPQILSGRGLLWLKLRGRPYGVTVDAPKVEVPAGLVANTDPNAAPDYALPLPPGL